MAQVFLWIKYLSHHTVSGDDALKELQSSPDQRPELILSSFATEFLREGAFIPCKIELNLLWLARRFGDIWFYWECTLLPNYNFALLLGRKYSTGLWMINYPRVRVTLSIFIS